jgi:hypothetical protein
VKTSPEALEVSYEADARQMCPEVAIEYGYCLRFSSRGYLELDKVFRPRFAPHADRVICQAILWHLFIVCVERKSVGLDVTISI